MRALTETAIFDTAFGLPLHSLVVHAAVVLVPLAAIGAVVMAFSPRFSRRFGALVVVVAIVGFGSSFIAKESGEALARRVGLPAEHAQLGDLMPVFALLLAGGLTVFWLFDRGIPGNRSRPWWLKVGAVLLVIVSVLAVYWTIRVGHSGAEAVWLKIM